LCSHSTDRVSLGTTGRNNGSALTERLTNTASGTHLPAGTGVKIRPSPTSASRDPSSWSVPVVASDKGVLAGAQGIAAGERAVCASYRLFGPNRHLPEERLGASGARRWPDPVCTGILPKANSWWPMGSPPSLRSEAPPRAQIRGRCALPGCDHAPRRSLQ
jgi:hypothetical protein